MVALYVGLLNADQPTQYKDFYVHCRLIKAVLFYDLRDTQTIEKHMQGAADFKFRGPPSACDMLQK